MNIDFFIKQAPSIIENQVKMALVKVAKENNIKDATQMNVLIHYRKGRILLMPHYGGKEIVRIPLIGLVNGEIGNALHILLLKIWNKEKQRYNIALELVNFIMKLQSNGMILVWPYHQGIYGDQMNMQQFLSL